MEQADTKTEFAKSYARLLANFSAVHIAASTALDQRKGRGRQLAAETQSHEHDKTLLAAVTAIRQSVTSDPAISACFLDAEGLSPSATAERIKLLTFADCRLPSGTGTERAEALAGFKNTAALGVEFIHQYIMRKHGFPVLRDTLREQAMNMQSGLRNWSDVASHRQPEKKLDRKTADAVVQAFSARQGTKTIGR